MGHRPSLIIRSNGNQQEEGQMENTKRVTERDMVVIREEILAFEE
jgi:hypothetical protein